MPDDLRDQFPKRARGRRHPILVYEMAGYEADDVIGTITRQLDDRDDLETTIVTVDLDMLQLVTPRVRLMTTRSGVENTVIYDLTRIDERSGLRPDQMIDYKALKGDLTDNIPGVPSGRKTAAKPSASSARSTRSSSASTMSPPKSCATSSASTASRC